MHNLFIFDGVSCADFGAYVHSMYPANVPTRVVEAVEIPGRNGQLIRDGRRFPNVEIIYQVYFKTNFREGFKALLAHIQKSAGYKRLEDTWDTEYYRMAYLALYETISVSRSLDSGVVSLTFSCKPQRFLKLGEQPITFTADGALWNPTQYEAKPFIRAYGTGTLTINGYTITVNYANGYTDIDCELQDAYRGVENCNGYISVTDYEYPVLTAGNNAVEIDGFSRVEITPRWWTV